MYGKAKEDEEGNKKKTPKKNVKMDPMEQAVVRFVEFVSQQNGPSYPSTPLYPPHGYPYGLMGAPSTFLQHTGMAPSTMFQPPILQKGWGSPPMYPAQSNNSNFSKQEQGLYSSAQRSVTGEVEPSSSELSPKSKRLARYEKVETGPFSCELSPNTIERYEKIESGLSSCELSPKTIARYERVEAGLSFCQLSPKITGTSACASVKEHSSSQVAALTPPVSSIKATASLATVLTCSEDADTGPTSSERAPSIFYTSAISEIERSSNHARGARRNSVIDHAGPLIHSSAQKEVGQASECSQEMRRNSVILGAKRSSAAGTSNGTGRTNSPHSPESPVHAPPQVSPPPVTSHQMNPFMYPWFYHPMAPVIHYAGHVSPMAHEQRQMPPMYQQTVQGYIPQMGQIQPQMRPMVQQASQMRPMVQPYSQMRPMVPQASQMRPVIQQASQMRPIFPQASQMRGMTRQAFRSSLMSPGMNGQQNDHQRMVPNVSQLGGPTGGTRIKKKSSSQASDTFTDQ